MMKLVMDLVIELMVEVVVVEDLKEVVWEI